MELTNRNNSCDNCPHRDHSGAFTPGGAQATCSHSDACKDRCEIPEQHRYDGKRRDKHHWYNRRIGNGNPSPNWCPLK